MAKKISQILVFTMILISLCLGSAYSADEYKYAKLTETLLNQDPDPVEPGDYVELRFKIEKEGNNILENIKYELIPKYPFSFDSSDTPIKELGDWVGNSEDKEFYILYYKLYVDDNAVEDIYNLTLKQTSTTNSAVKEIDVPIRVGESLKPNLVTGSVKTSPAKLIADYDEASIEVEITNVGDDKAQQVIATLNIPEGFEESFGYSNIVTLGTINAGETKTAKFYLDVNEGVLKGKYNSQIELKYKEDNNDLKDDWLSKNINFDISVFGRPEYKVLDTQVSEVHKGDKGQIKISIKNIGSKESDSTAIQIFKDSTQPFEFDDKSDFIGKMDVNSEGEAIFTFNVKEDAEAKEYKLKMQIRSVVDDDVLVQDESISVNVLNGEKNSSPIGSYILYAFLAIIILLIGFFVGKKSSNNKIKN